VDDERRRQTLAPAADGAPPALSAGEEPIAAEHYGRVRAGVESPASLGRLIVRRALALCARCREAWEILGADRRRLEAELDALAPADEPAPPLSQHLAVAVPEARRAEVEDRRLRRLKRSVTKELSFLRRTSRRSRADRVTQGRSRFASRALAARLIDESRRVVRADPVEAESFAALVPLVLAGRLGRGGPPWARALAARAEAHRANALRGAGDLPAAGRAFAALRAELGARPIDDPAVYAELASL